ncbi:hypothetical protein BJY00DRAFT_311843 [Aspergillus carlsbadensis]|nr:hypothetical protein BJY00DRAFT_311843 [Aspergillus carlsbadensis]
MALLISLFPAPSHTQNDTSEHRGSDKVGWVSAPDGRGTSAILWSCFVVFLVCSWKCTHLNVPSAKESEGGWHTTANGWIPYWPTWPYWKLVLRKIKWMFIIAIAPEVGAACAAQDFWRPRKLRNKVNLPGFTLTHAFYGLMGGFVLAIPMERAPGNETCPNRTQGGEGPVQLPPVEGHLPGVFESYSPKSIDPFLDSTGHSRESRRKRTRYNHRKKLGNIDEVVEQHIFPSLVGSLDHRLCFPAVIEQDINNQSNSDLFTKTFAVLQCL